MSGHEIVTIVGWPRSGTTWLVNLFKTYLNTDQVRQSHALPGSLEGYKHVFTTRDPRDSLTSLYFFHFQHHARYLGQTKKNLTMLDYFKKYFIVGGKYMAWLPYGWREYHEKWLSFTGDHPDITTSHEALFYDRDTEFPRILRGSNIDIDEKRLKLALDESRNAMRRSYTGGSNTAAGQPGEWENHFDDELARFVNDYCGDVALQLGYRLEIE